MLPRLVNALSDKIAGATMPFIRSRAGKYFLSLILIGPFTFVPTLWVAWTAPNIDALRTITWPSMFIINCAACVSVSHSGDWRMRFASILWVIVVFGILLAIMVR